MTTLREIAKEWNRNAASRCSQLDQSTDVSHHKVLVPWMLRLGGDLSGKAVVDAGCGCGFLTHALTKHAKCVTGIDISRRMIEEASRRWRHANLTFEVSSVEAFARTHMQIYDGCFSNMSLITMPNLDGALRSIANLVKSNGFAIFSITHPCFWHLYRRDEPGAKFDYWHPHAVTAPFRISLQPKPLPSRTTYFHRPLSQYVSSFHQAGLNVEAIAEPSPPSSAPREYTKAFRLPRFMFFRTRKT